MARCKVSNVVRLHLKLLEFTWDHEFKILNAGPFPVILGLDFLTRTQMVIDVSYKKFRFRFHPDFTGNFSVSRRGSQPGELFLFGLTVTADRAVRYP